MLAARERAKFAVIGKPIDRGLFGFIEDSDVRRDYHRWWGGRSKVGELGLLAGLGLDGKTQRSHSTKTNV
jgi:hypothetical protein